MSLTLLAAGACVQAQGPLAVQPGDDAAVAISADDVAPDETKLFGTVVIAEAGEPPETDDYVLNAAIVAGDTLAINVSYGGGCEEHRFTLAASSSFAEGLPAQLIATLVHDANGDPCEAWLTNDYHFDLGAIKTLYRETYGRQAGTLNLLVRDAPLGPLVYEFSD